MANDDVIWRNLIYPAFVVGNVDAELLY